MKSLLQELRKFHYPRKRNKKMKEIVVFAHNEREADELYNWALENPVKIPA